MGKHLIIASNDKTYTARLVKYIDQRYPGQYDIETIGEVPLLKERIQEQGGEILLIEASFCEGITNWKMVKLPILLEENSEASSKLDKIKWHMPKYLRVSQMVAYIEQQYEEVERTKPLVYSFYSPTGGVGTTTMALAVALTYIKAGRKVFYFSLEEWDSTALFLKEGTKVFPEESGATEVEQCLYKHLYQEKSTNILYWNRLAEEVSQEVKGHLGDMVEWLIDQEISQVVILDFGQRRDLLQEKQVKQLDYVMLTANQKETTIFKTNQVIEWLNSLRIKEKKIRLILNQMVSNPFPTEVEVAGKVEKLQEYEPIEISRQIAQQQYLHLHGLNE